MNNNIFSYTAGYVDGDGCFYIGKCINNKSGKIKYQSSLIISSTNDKVLKFFHKTHGGTTSLSDTRSKFQGQKPQYHFTVRSNKAKKLTELIIPYLVEKQEQAKIFCKFINTSNIEEKESLIFLMKDLKHNRDLINKNDKEIIMNNIEKIIPNEADFAYLAGFIDAECCLTISKYKPKDRPNFTYKICLSLNNSKLPVFKWLIDRFDGHINFIDRNTSNKKHRNQFAWRLTAKSLFKILPNIYPYLKYKKPVCKELIKFYETTLINGGARHTDEFRASYAEVLKIRDDIVHKIHILNQKGIV